MLGEAIEAFEEYIRVRRSDWKTNVPRQSSPASIITARGMPGTGLTSPKKRRWKESATLTNAIMTGTSTRGPMTAANAAPELIPKTATATAIASSKLLLAAVNDSVAVCE